MEKPKPILNYAQPVKRERTTEEKEAARYERNGWIGLAITLIVCLLVYLLFRAP